MWTVVVVTGRGVLDLHQLLAPGSRPDPYPILRRLWEESPFRARPGLVVVGRHRDCARLLRDPSISSERDRATLGGVRKGPRTRNFLHLDPPDHTRLRRLVSKAFSPRVVNELGPAIRERTVDLLTGPADRRSMDVVTELAYPLPVQVICELLGVPFTDFPVFQQWSSRLAQTLEPPLPGVLPPPAAADAGRARAHFVAYFRDLIAQRRAEPRDDLVSYLVGVEEAGDQLSESELVATCVLLLTGGHETTVNLISNAILALLRHPDHLRAVAGDPSLAAAVVEETLRYDAPVQLTSRVAREPFQLGKVEVQTGDLLLLLLAAANRDPEVFAEPDTFDIRRGVTPHLAFAAGPHFCLGANLGRLEGTIAVAEFARRVNGPRLSGAPVYKPHLNLRGPSRLPISFDP